MKALVIIGLVVLFIWFLVVSSGNAQNAGLQKTYDKLCSNGQYEYCNKTVDKYW